MSILDHFNNELGSSSSAFPELRDKWKRSTYRLSTAPHLIAHFQQDGRTDLILRQAEAEIIYRRDDEIAHAHYHYIALARYWILSMTESLRTFCAFRKKAQFGGITDERPSEAFLNEACALRDQYQMIRIPLAKLQIRGMNRKDAQKIETISFPPNANERPQVFEPDVTPYYPVMGIDYQTGSLSWQVIDTRNKKMIQISRQDLSNRYLELFAGLTNVS